METRYEVVGEYHVGVVADDHDGAPDPGRRWQAVAQVTRVDNGAHVTSVPAGGWFGSREEAVDAALRAGIARARDLPRGLQGEKEGNPAPE